MALVGSETINGEINEISDSIKSVLKKFGLTENELKVYRHLIRNGPQHANEIGKKLKIYRTETYRLLNSLQQKGMVNMFFDKPTKFVGIDYVKALDHIINTQINTLNELRLVRNSLLQNL